MLLVGNHSGGNVAPDTLVFTLAFYRRFGVERSFFQLAHHLVMSAPWLSALRMGGPPSDVARQPDRVRRPGRVRALALAADVPIVPVVSIGGQETAVVLTRGERVARALRLDRRFRLKVVPVSLALPWGLDIGDFFGHIALPAKITIQVLDPIDLREQFGPDPDVDVVYATVTELMQRTLDELAAQRRSPVIG